MTNLYNMQESLEKLRTYSEFYTLNSRIFPNYILLSESKYIFNNIKKKQKLLDNIEDYNYNKNNNNNENSQFIIMNYSVMNYNSNLIHKKNHAHSFNLNSSENQNRNQNSYYSTIFTPSIMNSIINDYDNSIKNESNISNVNFIIDNIHKIIKAKSNFNVYKTPKNKKIINNESENKKNNQINY